MRLVCFGDSNTYGYDPRSYFGGRYPAEHRWVDLLALETGWDIENQGMNGRSIPAVPDEFLLRSCAAADGIVIMLGSKNSVSRESGMAGLQEILRNNLRRGDIVTRIKDNMFAMLLPTVSEAHSRGDKEKIKTITINATFFVVFVGFLFGILFFMFSDFLGNTVFDEPLAAIYIRALCLLCPFMYVNGIFSGILQGLGKAMHIFFINITGLFLRLCFVFFAIPHFGIKGYLIGLLVSQLYSSGMYLWQCYRMK